MLQRLKVYSLHSEHEPRPLDFKILFYTILVLLAGKESRYLPVGQDKRLGNAPEPFDLASELYPFDDHGRSSRRRHCRLAARPYLPLVMMQDIIQYVVRIRAPEAISSG